MAQHVDKFIDDVLRDDPDAQKMVADALPRVRVAASLIRMRRALEQSQRDVARQLRKPQSTVARLERPEGRAQTTEALAAYAHACGAELGLVFVRPEGDGYKIVEAASVGREMGVERFLKTLIDYDEPEIAAVEKSAAS